LLTHAEFESAVKDALHHHTRIDLLAAMAQGCDTLVSIGNIQFPRDWRDYTILYLTEKGETDFLFV
jgi:hypothetical protein